MYGNADYRVRCRENPVNEEGFGQLTTLRNCSILYNRAETHETTCILHESFSSISGKYLMIVGPDVQCDKITLLSWVMVFLP